MTTDERLDRLTERHEALTQTVEIVVSMQSENAAAFQQVRADIDDLGRFIRALAEIVANHERRLDRLEG
jgi:archaellum component FlaC